jgi:hypothetical protein
LRKHKEKGKKEEKKEGVKKTGKKKWGVKKKYYQTRIEGYKKVVF